jgi:hypothetical protein
MRASGTDLPPGLHRDGALPFIPDRAMTADQLRRLLAEGPDDRRAWAISRLLLYADWEEIWGFTTREQVIELFPALELPPALRAAWARMLRLEEQPAEPVR